MKGYISKVTILNFVTTIIRSNIQYITNCLAEVNKGSVKEYIVVLKYIWRYIIGTKSLGLCIGGRQYISNFHLYIHSDTSFIDNLFIRVFTRSYIVFLAGCLIIWKNRKQTIVTISTIEAEFINFIPTIFNIKWIVEIYVEAGYL